MPQFFKNEGAPTPASALIKVCEDEAAQSAPTVALLGRVASGTTRLGTGNQKLYPDGARQAMQRLNSCYDRSLMAIADELGISFGVTSHLGCGGGNAQGISADEITSVTKQQTTEKGVPFWGQLPMGDLPQPLDGNQAVAANFSRPTTNHTHDADFFTITTGGGILGQEKEALEALLGGHTFQVSADAASRIINQERALEDLATIIGTELNVARTIAQGVRENPDPIVVYDAGRLSPEEAAANNTIVHTIFSMLGL